jgi:ABC-type histidine transport system ATPase subunit
VPLEPTSALDAEMRNEVLDVMKDLARERKTLRRVLRVHGTPHRNA